MADRARVEAYLTEAARALASVDPGQVTDLAGMVEDAWRDGRTVFTCGNGGSASTASHMALDLTKQTMVPGRRPLRAVSLTDNVGIITAWANDAGFDRVFAEQLRVHAAAGDVLVVISCSGRSANLVAAVEAAREIGLRVAVLGGFDGGVLRALADVYVHVESSNYGFVESVHVVVEHCLTTLLHEAATASSRRASDKPVVIVDRDGVLNRNLEDGVRSWQEFEFLPGALAAMAHLAAHGHRVVVVTNQANVGRGLVTRAQLDEIHRRMSEAVLGAGGELEAIHACEHSPEAGCDCRKPAPGLLRRAAAQGAFDLTEAYFVGDHHTDVEAAQAAGARSVLVMSGRATPGDNGNRPDFVVDDILAAATLVVDRHRQGSTTPASSALSTG